MADYKENAIYRIGRMAVLNNKERIRMADYKEDVLVDKVETSAEELTKRIDAYLALGYAVSVRNKVRTGDFGKYLRHVYTIYVYKPTEWDDVY